VGRDRKTLRGGGGKAEEKPSPRSEENSSHENEQTEEHGKK
jgi:hypothetical protein